MAPWTMLSGKLPNRLDVITGSNLVTNFERNSSLQIHDFTMDEGSTIFARLRNRLDLEIAKISDVKHVSNSVRSVLYKIRNCGWATVLRNILYGVYIIRFNWTQPFFWIDTCHASDSPPLVTGLGSPRINMSVTKILWQYANHKKVNHVVA